MADLLHVPIPHEEGRRLVRDKVPVTRRVFEGLLPELQGRAMYITGIECLNAVQRVRDLAAELPTGGDFKDLHARILDEISPWLITADDPEEAAKQRAEAVRRAEMLLRMHGWQAYAQTQYEEMEEMKDVFPYRQYLSSEDSRVRQTHAALNRKVFPADHPFWHNHTPPWEFGCRCDVVALMEEDVDDIRAGEASKAIEERQVMEGPMLEEIERGNLVMPGGTGKLDIRTPREKKGSSGYEWRPGDRQLDLDAVLARYDAPARQAFEGWAKEENLDDGRTLWEAFGGEPAAPQPQPGPGPAELPPARKKRARRSEAAKMRDKISKAEFVRETPIGAPGVNTTIRLRNGVEVVFKPAAGEHPSELRSGIRPGEQYLREKAASIIDEHLGTNLVPPTEIVTYRGQTGSAQIFRGGWRTAAMVAHEHRQQMMRKAEKGERIFSKPFAFDDETERRWSLLDSVLGHLDRHPGNYLVRRDDMNHKLALIDNGLCLSEDPRESGTRFSVPLAGDDLDDVSREQLDSFLARREQWDPQVRALVGDAATELIYDRIRRLKEDGFGLRAACSWPF